MSSKEAYEHCPQAIFISGNYEKYKAVGLEIRAIFKRYTDLIEPMSIDEAYLDVTWKNLAPFSPWHRILNCLCEDGTYPLPHPQSSRISCTVFPV